MLGKARLIFHGRCPYLRRGNIIQIAAGCFFPGAHNRFDIRVFQQRLCPRHATRRYMPIRCSPVKSASMIRPAACVARHLPEYTGSANTSKPGAPTNPQTLPITIRSAFSSHFSLFAVHCGVKGTNGNSRFSCYHSRFQPIHFNIDAYSFANPHFAILLQDFLDSFHNITPALHDPYKNLETPDYLIDISEHTDIIRMRWSR